MNTAKNILPLTSTQLGIYYDQLLNPTSALYNVGAIVSIKGKMNFERFDQACRTLLLKHPILTAIVGSQEGAPVLKIKQEYSPRIHFKDNSNDSYAEITASINRIFQTPYDLASEELLCDFYLFKESDSSYFFFSKYHHILTDGWGTSIVFKELTEIYNNVAFVNAEPGTLEAYSGMVLQDTAYFSSEAYTKDVQYWQQRLNNRSIRLFQQVKSTIAIPCAKEELSISRQTILKLGAVAQQLNISVFHLFIAAIASNLSRIYKKEEFSIGIPLANRNRVNSNLIGLVSSVIPVIVKVGRHVLLPELASGIKRSLLSDFRHRRLPTREIMNVSEDIRTTSTAFDVLFSYMHHSYEYEFAGCTCEVRHLANSTQKFPLAIYLSDFDSRSDVQLELIYNETIIPGCLARQFLYNIVQVVDALVNGTPVGTSDFRFTLNRENQLLLQNFNHTKQKIDRRTIVDLFEEQVILNPSAAAVLCNGLIITYEQLNKRANCLASHLRSSRGIGRGDLIGLLFNRSENIVITILAIAKTGAAYIPLDESVPEERLKLILSNTRCKLLLVSSDRKLPELQETCLAWEQLVADSAQQSDKNLSTQIEPDDIAYINFTSGSTGVPKGVIINHGNLSNFVYAANEIFAFTAEHHLLANTSISFDISFLELIWPLCVGSKVTINSLSAGQLFLDRYLSLGPQTIDFSLFYFSSLNHNDQKETYDLFMQSVVYADQNGFKAVWIPERHFHQFGGIFPNPSLLGAAVASITSAIEIRSGSVVLPIHDPIRVAEEWSVVDNLSRGRVSLSFASGWHADDFVFFPERYVDRRVVMYENIQTFRHLWQGGSVKRINGAGKEIQVRVFPRPVQQNIAIWITSAGDIETFREAGRIGANVLTNLIGQDLGELKTKINAYKDSLKANGFDASSKKIALMVHAYLGANLHEVKQEVRDPFKKYLASSASLLTQQAKSLNIDVSKSLHKDMLEKILESGFERYWSSATIFGTPEHCETFVRNAADTGITDLACLIDFGMSQKDVMKGLPFLNDLKNKFSTDGVSLKVAPVNVLQATPSHLALLLDDKHSHNFLASLKVIIAGGEKLPKELVLRLREISSAALFNMYGPTETTIWSSFEKINDDDDINIGRPFLNTEILIIDENCQLIPVGAIGEIIIGGLGVAAGYLNEAILTDERFVNLDGYGVTRFYRTGDLGYWREDGKLQIIGRNDNQIKLNGFRIELEEIESALRKCKGVHDAVCILDDQGSQPVIISYCIFRNKDVEEADLYTELKKRLPYYMVPSRIEEVDAFPLTYNGKIDRKTLKKSAGRKLISSTGKHVITGHEKGLADIWKDILNLRDESIAFDSDFFQLGGHSISVNQLLTRIKAAFGVTLTFKSLFENRTLGEQITLVKQSKPEVQTGITVIEEQQHFRALPEQERMWVLHNIIQNQAAYNEPKVYHISGQLEIQKLESAFKKIIGRYESLRLSFKPIDGQLRYFIKDNTFALRFHDLRRNPFKSQKLADLIREENSYNFNLEHDLLVRASALQLEDDEFILVFIIHHIISDGRSIEIIVSELAQYYNNGIDTLIELPLNQFKDYSAFVNSKSSFKQHESFWRNKFKDGIPTLNLTTDYRRPALQDFLGQLVHVKSSLRVDELKKTADKHQATTFALLLTAVKILLFKYSGQTDLVIGTPADVRTDMKLHNQVGLLINMLPIRTSFSEESNFTDLLKTVASNVLEAHDHREYPFAKLVDSLNLPKEMGRSGVFDVAVIYQNTSTIEAELNTLHNIKATSLKNFHTGSRLDFTIEFFESNGTLDFQIEYSTSLFKKDTIERMGSHLDRILREIMKNQELRITQYQFLSDEEIHKQLFAFNTSSRESYSDIPLIERFENQVLKTPHRIAVTCSDRNLSYSMLNSSAESIAANLINGYHLKGYERIGILIDRSEHIYTSILAVLKCGCTYVPIDPSNPSGRIRQLISESDLSVLITEARHANNLGDVANIFILDEQLATRSQFSSRKNIQVPAYIIYTSGSTGVPKGVMIRQASVNNLIDFMQDRLQTGSDDVFMALATIAFDLSVPDIFLPIFFGSKVVVVPSSETKDPYALIHLLETSRPTAMQATPTTWEMLIESNWNGDPNHLKIVCGGEALSKGLSERLLRKCKKLWNMYGPTETTVWSTAGLIHPDEDIHIGRPINNTRIAILNKHQQLIPDGHVGEIYILGDGVSNGYFNRTDLTREKFVPLNLFNTGEIAYRTGDIGRWDNNGNIEYLGRIDQQVKINGYRVECGEVEAAITQYDGIHKAVVRMTSSITTGKILTAYFTADHEIDEHDLRLFLRKTLPEFMVPGNYFQLQTFPVNANGKVDVKNLPEPLNDQSKKKKVHAPAAGLIENQIADVWQEVLGRSDLSVTDNFFETGGSSMRVLALFRELNILFPNILKVPDLFENATISDQASLIQKRSNSSVRKAEFNVLEY